MLPGARIEDLPVKGVFRLRGLDMTRLETFTDAAFAFALTLLVISLEPPTSAVDLRAALREIPAFVVSGSLLMMFWWAHHEWSRRFGLEDGVTVVLTCVLVFTVLIYVVPLRFMFGLFFVWIAWLTGLPIGSPEISLDGPGDVNTMFAVYGFGFMSMAGSVVLLNLHAWRLRGRLELSPAEAFETLSEAGVWAILAATGALSALLALVLPASVVGLPGWAYMLLPVVMPLYASRMNARRERLHGGSA
jgi:uncharacterized membrane protein